MSTQPSAGTSNTDRVQVDDRLTGLNFIEVLFALVVARTLEPIANYRHIPAVGWAHLAVAGVLTITSWIGYHNSRNRPRFFITFGAPIWPLLQFLIDVALVVVYWLTATSAEGTGTELGARASAKPEALLVLIAFVLYCLWDWVGLEIRKDRRFGRRLIENDSRARRAVTWVTTFVALALCGTTWLADPRSTGWIVVVDGLLVVLLIGFRVAKDHWRPAIRPAPRDPTSSSERLVGEAEAALRRLRQHLAQGNE
jgi:hypothetical protein